MSQESLKALRQAEAELRAVLDDIFASSESFVFEDVVERFQKCINFDFDCLIYINERRWFQDSASFSQDYLKFNYLALELRDGVTSRFASQRDLVQREALVGQEGYVHEHSRLCTIWFNSPFQIEELRRLINLTKRIFVAFYKNCGARDHFLESVSRRFIQEFYAVHPANPTTTQLVRHIENKCKMRVSIWNQKDEMFFHQTSDASELLIHEASSGFDYAPLFEDGRFQFGLKTSVTRKNQTYGKSSATDIYYVIKTFSDTFFIGETKHANFKTQQKAVAIYSAQGQPLSLDGIWHANRLIDTYLRTTQETQYHSIILGGTHRCAELEAKLSAHPVETRDDLLAQITSLLNALLFDIATHTRAEVASLYLHEPFADKLQLVAHADASGRSVEPVKSIALNGILNSVSAQSFSAVETIEVWHPTKLTQDWREAVSAGLDTKASAIAQALERRRMLRDNLGRAESASVALPIKKGNLVVGVLEFSSSDVGRLSYEARFFELVASMCGDIIRRLELANDRGWLSRMSFIHAARHRIEAVIRDVRATNAPIAQELVGIIERGSILKPQKVAGDRFSDCIKQIEKLLQRYNHSPGHERIIANLEAVNALHRVSDIASELLYQVFETLLVNSSHSSFQSECVLIALKESSDGGGIHIQYAPRDVAIPITRMQNICDLPPGSSLVHNESPWG